MYILAYVLFINQNAYVANNDPTVHCSISIFPHPEEQKPRFTDASKSSIRFKKAQLEANKVPLSRLRAITPHRVGFEPSLLIVFIGVVRHSDCVSASGVGKVFLDSRRSSRL